MKALVSRSRVLICCATFLCVLLGLAGCETPVTLANPAANKLDVSVTISDARNALRASSNTIHIAIVLALAPQPHTVGGSQTIEGSDAKTLVCNGNTQLQFSGGSYAGDVPAQTDQYTCTYYWSNGTRSADIVIPVLIRSLPSIRDPASGDTVSVPASGDPGVTVSYDGSGATGAQVVATASDYNQRSALSDPSPDRGVVTIPADRFESSFGIGWGTITLTRSLTDVDISARPSNTAFHSVKVSSFDQAAATPVRWL